MNCVTALTPGAGGGTVEAYSLNYEKYNNITLPPQLSELSNYKMISFVKGVREKFRRGSLPDILDGFTKLTIHHSNKRSNSFDLHALPDEGTRPVIKTLKKAKPDPVSQILLGVLDKLNNEEKEKRKQLREKRKQRRENSRIVRRERLVNYSDTSSDDEEAKPEVSSLEVYKELLQLRFLQIRSRMTREQTFSPELKYEISKMNGMKSLVDRLKNVTMSDLVLPDYTGWLTDQTDCSKNYCVIADMLFCIFENETSEHPKEVMLLPGCSVRSLVYKTPDSDTGSNSKTISGLDRYQIVIDDSGSRRKYLFSVETDTELLECMSALKTASNLDHDTYDETKTASVEPRRHSICYEPSSHIHGTQGSHISPKYIPSPRSSNRSILQAFSGTESNNEPEKVDTKGSPGNGSEVPIDDFRKRLRRDTEPETSKPVPLKATYFTESPIAQKKLSPFKRFRSFGSLENLFKPKRRNSKSGDSTDSQSIESAEIPSPNGSVLRGSFDMSSSKQKLKGSKRLSRSLEFDKSEPSGSKGLVRRASDLKDKITKSGKSDFHSIKLVNLLDTKVTGFLQHKFLIKWQKLWCIVSRGCFYGFKSQSPDENPHVALNLTNCTVSYVSDRDKRYKKLFVFKLAQQGRKSHYFNAPDNTELSKWLQTLQMEASKVQTETEVSPNSHSSSESLDSAHSLFMKSSQSSVAPVAKPRRTKTVQSENDMLSKNNTTVSVDVHRRKSMPVTLPGNSSENDVEGSSTDDWQNSGSDNVCVTERFGVPGKDTPEHDQALKEVWQKDRNYLFNIVRAKLRTYKKRRENIYNTDLPGPNNEGLLMVTDDGVINTSANKLKGNSRDVRRSHSFNVKPTSMAEGAPDSPPASPTPMKKKHKPLCVKKLAARDIEDTAMSSYMERRSFSGQWIRYWYVLKEGTLFCYLTPDDNVTADILNLTGYKVSSLIDKFRGKRFVLQLSHEEFASTYLSAESREEMNVWLESLESATGEMPCANGLPDDDSEVFSTEIPLEPYQDKCNSVKQKLLAEMLRQKHELERKQASRQKQKLQQPEGDRLLHTWSPEMTSDEKLISDVTKLRQRRMSAQIKVDAIQKQMQPQQTSNKKFFNFGGKKKQPVSKSEHLEGQLKELTEKLQKIDQDLSSHNYDLLDKNFNQNKKHVNKHSHDSDVKNSSDTVNSDNRRDLDSNKNSSNLKSSVQKLAQKTFTKSFKNKHKKENGTLPIINGHLESPTSESRDFYGDDAVDAGDVVDKYRSDSLTDLTKDKLNNNDLKLDLSSFNDQYEESGPKRISRKSESSSMTSPRREIDPNVMAEIEAFEELTRQALSARTTAS